MVRMYNKMAWTTCLDPKAAGDPRVIRDSSHMPKTTSIRHKLPIDGNTSRTICRKPAIWAQTTSVIIPDYHSHKEPEAIPSEADIQVLIQEIMANLAQEAADLKLGHLDTLSVIVRFNFIEFLIL